MSYTKDHIIFGSWKEGFIMTKSEKLALLEEMFELDEGKIDCDTVLDDLEEWDSMSKLSLIVLMRDEFGKKISSSDIKGLVRVGDIINIME